MRSISRQYGFTLVELIMVIVIIGVIGGMVAVFMKSPIDAYIDSGRRAALTDVADTVVRRIARDLQGALPNSIRPGPAGTNCLEFVPTKTGGRYRATGASLDFTTGSSSFNMLGDNTAPLIPADQLIAQNDVIVVYNLDFAPANVYTGTNWETVSATPTVSGTPPETTINLSSTKVFPLESGSRRFHVVPGSERMVSYVCSGSSLRRTASAAFTATASCPATGPVIANNVNCATANTWFNYTNSVDLQRNGLVSMGLTISDSSGTESITLQHEVHVSNTP